MQEILVVEDEHPISLLLQVYLEKSGYSVHIADDGEQALAYFEKNRPDLVLLDLMLPGKDGWVILNEIRKQSSCPIIILTARGDVKDRLNGFAQGADDYIPKPFDPEEVVARVRAVLRRPVRLVEQDTVCYGSLMVNFTSCEVSVNGKVVSLAPRDWDLLAFLVRHPNQVFTRDQLIDRIWGIDYEGGDRAVDLAVKRLRKSLINWPDNEGEIITIRGTGYSLRV